MPKWQLRPPQDGSLSRFWTVAHPGMRQHGAVFLSPFFHRLTESMHNHEQRDCATGWTCKHCIFGKMQWKLIAKLFCSYEQKAKFSPSTFGLKWICLLLWGVTHPFAQLTPCYFTRVFWNNCPCIPIWNLYTRSSISSNFHRSGSPLWLLLMKGSLNLYLVIQSIPKFLLDALHYGCMLYNIYNMGLTCWCCEHKCVDIFPPAKQSIPMKYQKTILLIIIELHGETSNGKMPSRSRRSMYHSQQIYIK